MHARAAFAVLIALALAAPAGAQIPLIVPIPAKKAKPTRIGPPPNAPPAEAEIWPYPLPDPKTWWDDKRPKPDEAADPLGGRHVRSGERLPQPDNGVDAATYRLWGLMPLQWQLLRGDEAVIEVWVRPADSVRQSVVRLTLRGDGDAFVQGRAGLASSSIPAGGSISGRKSGSRRSIRSATRSPPGGSRCRTRRSTPAGSGSSRRSRPPTRS